MMSNLTKFFYELLQNGNLSIRTYYIFCGGTHHDCSTHIDCVDTEFVVFMDKYGQGAIYGQRFTSCGS